MKNADSTQNNTTVLKGIGRAFGGAILFALPMMMTMEMWWLGFYVNEWKLALFLLANFLLLVGLAYHAGFRQDEGLMNYTVDALVAKGVAIITVSGVLITLAVITFSLSPANIVGKIAIESVPASIGALLARSIMGGQKVQMKERKKSARYLGELFLMLAGAIFFSFAVAPTKEMLLITFRMTGWHSVALTLLSLLLMHLFVYVVEFRGAEDSGGSLSLFLRFTLVGYAIALLISTYMLWTFDRLEGLSLAEAIRAIVVLGFPAALGAATARLIL